MKLTPFQLTSDSHTYVKNQDGRLEKSNLLAIDFGCSCFLRPGELNCDLAGSPMYLAPEAVAVRIHIT